MRVFLLQIDDLDRVQHAAELREKMASVLASRTRIDEDEDRRFVGGDGENPLPTICGFAALEIAVQLGTGGECREEERVLLLDSLHVLQDSRSVHATK